MAEQFRITAFGEGRAPWRASYEAAMDDAKALGLASYDQEGGEWFVPVPGEIERQRLAEVDRGRHGQRWNDSDVTRLRYLARGGRNIDAIGKMLRRSPEACATKARELGIEVPHAPAGR